MKITKENILKRKELIKDLLEPYIKKGEVGFEISDDCKIYIGIKETILDEFVNKFESIFHIYKDNIFEYEDMKEGWKQFDYLPLYDAIISENVDLLALAYLLEELDYGKVPFIIKMELEEEFGIEI